MHMRGSPRKWNRHPVVAGCLRVAIVAVPVAAGLGAGLLVAELVAPPTGVVATVGWVVLVLAATTVTVLAVDRLTRRLAPLALLLRLAMVFPDAAPRRFRVAMRAVRPQRLADRLAEDDQASPDLALSLMASLLAHDRQTRGHSERVAAFTAMLAEQLDLPEEEALRAEWGGLLHDVGKLEVPGSLLRKPGGLDEAEWEQMREHPEAGRRLVEPLEAWLGDGLRAVDGHHERWDGTGYPGRAAGEQIPLAARIVSVADAFETMTAARSYKDPIAREEARAELAACAGGQFDPAVVRAFLTISVPRLWLAAGPAALLVQLPLLGSLLRSGSPISSLSSAASGATAAAGQVGVAALIGGTALVATGVAESDHPAEADTTVVAPGLASSAPPVVPVGTADVETDVDAPAPPLADAELQALGAFLVAVDEAEAAADPGAPGDGTDGQRSTESSGAPEPPSAGADTGPVGTPPGRVPGANPGHGGTPPGLGGTPPGQIPGGNPGHGGTPPGHGGTPPGLAR